MTNGNYFQDYVYKLNIQTINILSQIERLRSQLFSKN